jgi:hypothetical protein
MEKFALSLPSFGSVNPPSGVPSGGLSTFSNIINVLLTVFLVIIVLLAIGYILWGSIRYIIARGEAEKIKGAREKITYAIVGLIVAFLAFLIVNTTGTFFNVNLLTMVAPSPGPTPIPTTPQNCPAPTMTSCTVINSRDLQGNWTNIGIPNVNYRLRACDFNTGSCTLGDLTINNFGFVRNLAPAVYQLEVMVESASACNAPSDWSNRVTCSLNPTSTPAPTLPPCPGVCRDEGIGCFAGETEKTPTVCDTQIGPKICCIAGPTPTLAPTATSTPVPTSTPIPTPTPTPLPTATPTPFLFACSDNPTGNKLSCPPPDTPACELGERCDCDKECKSGLCDRVNLVCIPESPFGIRGTVWVDIDGDQKLDEPPDAGRSGIDITATYEGNLSISESDKTNSSGNYLIDIFVVGTYLLHLDESDIPSGFILTVPNDVRINVSALGPSSYNFPICPNDPSAPCFP